jgi:hypothetical protein
MDGRERERFVVAALNLGEIEMNGRDRESMGEKKYSHGCCCSKCVVEEKERWACMCMRKHTIHVTRLLD